MQVSEIFKHITVNKNGGDNLDKRIFFLILQIISIIGTLLFTYYFVWSEQGIHFMIWTVMVISIILLGFLLTKKFKRDNNINSR